MEKIWYGVIVLAYRQNPLKLLLVKTPKRDRAMPIFCSLGEKETYAMGAIRELKEVFSWKIKVNQFTQTNLKYEFVYGTDQEEKAGSKSINLVLLLDTSDFAELKSCQETAPSCWLLPDEAVKKIDSVNLKEILKQAVARISLINSSPKGKRQSGICLKPAH